MSETIQPGAWPSPITAEVLVQGSSAVGELRVDRDLVWWSEQRPDEGGRNQLVRLSPDGSISDLFDPIDSETLNAENWNARTAYLEYGGGFWTEVDGRSIFANW